MIEITKAYLDNIKLGKVRHRFYDKTVKHAQDMVVHVEG